METSARCPICGRNALTENWLKARIGLPHQVIAVFKPHRETANASIECPMSGHAVLPAQKTPGQRW